MMQEPVSLATPVGEEEDSRLEDFIEDQNSPNPVSALRTCLYGIQGDSFTVTLLLLGCNTASQY